MKYGLLDDQLELIEKALCSHPEIETAVLYGSRAINTFKEASDVDIALKGKKVNKDLAINLKIYFEEETDLPYFFDCLSYHDLDNKKLKEQIDKYGIVIYRKAWKKVKLGDVVILNYGKSLPETKRVFGKIPVYSSAGLTGWHTEALIKDRGIIIGRKGTIGSVYKSNTPFFPIDTTFYISEKETNCNIAFLFYVLSNLGLNKLNSDSAVPGLNRNFAYAQEFLLPLLSEQKTIAEVLSSLDDKIELLHKQNKTLEDLAQTFFRQWFIEDAQPNWDEKPLSYFGKIICGKTPSKKIYKYFGDDVLFIKIPDMHGNTFIFKTGDALSKSGESSQIGKTLPEKSICVSCIATVGLVSMNAFKCQTNQQINSIIPDKEGYRYFIYLFMKSSTELLKAMASGGTATMNLNTGNFSTIKVPTANKKIISQFHNIVNPLFEKIFHNQSQILNLEQLRDILLPKLINGSVKVRTI